MLLLTLLTHLFTYEGIAVHFVTFRKKSQPYSDHSTVQCNAGPESRGRYENNNNNNTLYKHIPTALPLLAVRYLAAMSNRAIVCIPDTRAVDYDVLRYSHSM